MCKSVLVAFLAAHGFFGSAVSANAVNAPSGQTAQGMSTTEPAVNDANGSLIFLHTPDKVPFPSNSNPRAAAPMYIPMYPTTSPINPATLNCQPHNCNHLNVLPFFDPAGAYASGGADCIQYRLPKDGCSLVIGHDHLVGVPHTGDFNVAWHVTLVVFTPLGVTNGAVNARNLTLEQIATLVKNNYAFLADTPVTFNCSIVPSTVYYKGVPLSF